MFEIQANKTIQEKLHILADAAGGNHLVIVNWIR